MTDAQAGPPVEGGNEDLGEVLTALADDTRRGIVALLAAGQTPTATELAGSLPITRQAVTKHLRVLEDAHLVVRERRGRETRYRLRAATLEVARGWLDEVGATWDRRLALLKEQAERDADA